MGVGALGGVGWEAVGLGALGGAGWEVAAKEGLAGWMAASGAAVALRLHEQVNAGAWDGAHALLGRTDGATDRCSR